MKPIVLALLCLGLLSTAEIYPSSRRSSGSSRRSYSSRSERKKTFRVKSRSHNPPKAWATKTSRRASSYGLLRDEKGRIKRSESAKASFMRSHPCPSTGKRKGPCPGYVVDHVRPLASGGADNPSNMQWQTEGAAKEKNKWERAWP